MLAGIGAADITPPVGTPLQGHFSLHPESRGILAPLEIRTVAFQAGSNTLVIITADLIGVPLDMTRRVRSAIAQKHGIPASHILIAGSHTHCGPATLACIGLRPIAEILARIETKMIGSVDDAIQTLEPATLGVGASSAHFNINRRPYAGQTEMVPNAAGVVDPRVRILRVDRRDGSPLAILFHYSCHPTAKNGSDGLISPDYPGIARANVEKHLHCRAAFLPGCFGNIRPNLLGANGNFASATAEQLENISHQLSRSVITAARFTRTFSEECLLSVEKEVFFPYGSMLPAAQIEPMAQRKDQPLRADWARRHLPVSQQGGPAAKGETSRMQAMQIGPLALLTIPGKPAQEIGYEIERHSLGLFDDLWPIGYANDQLGYFCTARMYEEGGYEPTAYVVYDRPAPYQNEAQIILSEAGGLLSSI